jgi:ubiquinone/menaquinone biosynthesis C-methylase UbiE
MKSNQNNNLNQESIEKMELSKKLITVWENHMKSFCSGRESAFNLSSELILSLCNSDNLHILDVACGYGGWSKFLDEIYKKQNLKVEFTGMDESEQRLNVYQDMLMESAKTIQGNILNTLPNINENYFNSAILGWASHEIESSQLEQVYKGINRALKPKGFLLMVDFVSELAPEIENLSIQLIKKRRDNLMLDEKSREQEQWLKEINKHNHSKHHHGEHQRHKKHYFLKEHFNFLNNAGFSVVEEVWRYMNSSMILAIK